MARWWVFACVLAMFPSTILAQEPLGVDYSRDIKPLLRHRCLACHGALKQEGELRLDTVAAMISGGSSGPAIVPGPVSESGATSGPGTTSEPGEGEASLLLQRISEEDEFLRMPPEGEPLTPDQIEMIRQWIAFGANAPSDELPEQDPEKHWAFQKPVRPAIPAFVNETHPGRRANPIDALIAAKRDQAAIQPLPRADRALLFRRLHLDLTGLPPTVQEIENFLSDDSPQAYARAVDRLLNSPQHGEHWARHWMDVWRYSDWYGRRNVPDVLNSYPMIWRWRDWIVRSVNEDKPYDRMIREMLAADELYPTDHDNLVATGFLVRSWFKWNYETWKKDLVEHTGKAFLGLTLNCAQCHDHKYDPLTQEEYFRFRAIFEPIELRHGRVRGEPDPGPFQKYIYPQSYGPIQSGMVHVFDEYLDAETYMFAKGDARLRMEGKPPVSPGVPARLTNLPISPTEITLPIEVAYPGMGSQLIAEERTLRQQALEVAQAKLDAARATTSDSSKEPQAAVEQAAKALQSARESAARRQSPDSDSPVLSGTQSLVLDAQTGRRALAHPLPDIASLGDDGSVSFLVKLARDGNTNLQLALDIHKGLTGGFIAFENGKIKTYAPGGFNEVVVGEYAASTGQNQFQIQMKLDVPRDRFTLTVTSMADGVPLVKDVEAGLNGWKPEPNGKRGLFLDCQTGTIAVYDDILFQQADGKPLTHFQFEHDAHSDGSEVVGTQHWRSTSFSVAPATSLILSAVSDDPAVKSVAARLKIAQARLRLPERARDAAQARVDASEKELASLEARVQADALRYSTGKLDEDRKAEPTVLSAIHAACQAERESAVAKARADLAAAELARAQADIETSDAASRADQAQIDAARKAMESAATNLATAQAALATAEDKKRAPLDDYSPLSPKYPQRTTGRRAALAEWIASRDNPLTARVMVNHIWLRHFGQPLVETTSDFGRNGSLPTHPELLDWLACEFMNSGWSMKHLHRLIVNSETYKMASMIPATTPHDVTQTERAEQTDPQNRLYWHFPTQRMRAEVVRDSLLAVADKLDSTIGGREIDNATGFVSSRRSIYFSHHGEGRMPFLELFDSADTTSCYRRVASIRPQQALALHNSELSHEMSQHVARQEWETVRALRDLHDDATRESRFIHQAFLRLLNRSPKSTEVAASRDFLKSQARALVSDGNMPPDAADARARENFIHALMNHNDFVTIR